MGFKCSHWSECGVIGGGCCDLHGRISFGVCKHTCTDRDNKGAFITVQHSATMAAAKKKRQCGVVIWPKNGWQRIFTLGIQRWHGTPWPLRKPRPKLGRKFPWLMQPTEYHRGCGCPVKTKAAWMAIRFSWLSFKNFVRSITRIPTVIKNA